MLSPGKAACQIVPISLSHSDAYPRARESQWSVVLFELLSASLSWELKITLLNSVQQHLI